ncbi:unnamed protein product [Closterium sp. Yama58-4]|nr:unnamed protein product [Closterium sp. Yama58-4]
MSESIPLTSTTSETEGAYSPPLLFEHAQPAECAENHEHAERWADDVGDVKVTVSEHLVSHTADSPPLKAEPKEEQAEARKAAAWIPQKSFGYPTAGGWNDFDKSSAIFNFSERPVRDAGWRFVFAVPLVVLVVAALFAFVAALLDPSPLLLFPFLYPIALIILFAFSLPLPVLIVSSLRKIPARVLNALMILAAVICALQSATSAVHYFASPALVPPNAADVSPVVNYGSYSPGDDGSSSSFSINTDVPESAEGESGETNEGSGGMMGGEMGEEEEAAMMDAIMADEAKEGTQGGMMEGGMEGGTEGAMGEHMEGQEDPSEAAVSSAGHVATEAESSSSAPTSTSSAPSGSSSAAATSDLGRGLLELILPTVAHPVVTVTAQHAGHWVRVAHSAARRHLQVHASDAEKGARGRSLQGENRLYGVAPLADTLVLRPLYFIAFVVLGLLSVVAMLLVLRCSHHLSLAASAVAHAAQTTVSQAPVIFLMPLPVILAFSFLVLPFMCRSDGASVILFVLLLPIFLFVAQVLSALLTYCKAAVFARLYVTTSSSSSSSRGSSEDGKAGEREEGVSLRGQLELFSSAFSLACTSSLGTCCAVAFTTCTTTIVLLLLSALSLALLGQGVIGCLLVALLHCTQLAIHFFLNSLILPTAAMSGHGFARSLRLSIDILRRFLAAILTANAAALALLAVLLFPVLIINSIFGVVTVVLRIFATGGGLESLVENIFIAFIVYAVSLLSTVALSSVLTTGVATTVLCFAWDKKLEPEEGSDAAGLVGDGFISSADAKDTTGSSV